jgi:hypothetical protein
MRLIAALLAAATLGGCATATTPATTDPDDFQIRATVLAVYNVLSGPAGRRDWNRFEALFAPNAHITVATANGADVLTPKEYGERAKPGFDAKGWFERPVTTTVERYGGIAHVWSAYEGREAANQEQAGARGVNSFELVRIGGEWKVQSIVRQAER